MSKPKTRTGKSSDHIGDLAEIEAARWLKQGRIDVNTAHRDRRGWDIIAQLPREAGRKVSSLDTRPAEISCFIQVKATTTEDRRLAVKLDNWDRAVKEPIPWFYLILEYSKKEKFKNAFLVHVDSNLAQRVLARLRKMEISDEDTLHKKYMDLTWGEGDQLKKRSISKDIENTIRAAVGDQADYAVRKAAWRDDAGDGGSTLRFTFKFKNRSKVKLMREMVDFAIGLRETLPATITKAESVRFGIPKVVTKDYPTGGVFVHRPRIRSAGGASLRFDAADGTDSVCLQGDVYSSLLYFPFLPEQVHKTRIALPMISFIIAAGGEAQFTFNLPQGDTPVALGDLVRTAKAIRLLSQGAGTRVGIETELLGTMAETSIDHVKSTVSNEMLEYLSFAEKAGTVLRYFGIGEFEQVLPIEIDQQRRAILLLESALTSEVSLGMEFPVPTPVVEGSETAVVWVAMLRFGQRVLVAIMSFQSSAIWPAGTHGEMVALNNARVSIKKKLNISNSRLKRLEIAEHAKLVSIDLERAGIDYVFLPTLPASIDDR